MKKIFFGLLFFLYATFLVAQIELPNILSDNMVLQRNTTVKLWGKAKPNALVTIKCEWSEHENQIKSDKDGYWEIKIETLEAGGPYSLRIFSRGESKILNNILLGEVWICAGQSNMSMPVRGFIAQPVEGALDAITESVAHTEIRMFTADRVISKTKEFNVKGAWQAASLNTTGNFSAIGYFYALELKKALQVPIGMINISWGGSNAQAWMSLDLLKLFPEIDIYSIDMESKSPQRIPTALHNAMFYPVSKYTAKGIIWYQGEANVKDYKLYSKIFPAMVKEWRETMNLGEIPFYYVQIAPEKYSGPQKRECAFLREVQQRSQYLIPNSGMVTTGDVGEENLIHPAKKKEISKRLSYWALAKTYGFIDLPHSPPIYRKKEIVGNKIKITFDSVNRGLILKGDPKTVFEIAGDDNVFFPADAKVVGNKKDVLEVWAAEVAAPEHVRYGFKNYFESILFDNYMIPASPFRTDFLEQ